jgi:hypothetical protein
MSEYVTVETEPTDDPDVLEIVTNQTLTPNSEEVYPDAATAENGSPIAHMLFGVEGVRALTITESTLLVRRDPEAAWEAIVDEIRDALRDFFL